MKKHKIILLNNHEIDKTRWNAGIKNSNNPLIYAESWFLDVVTPNWKAVISEDYSILWPLTINRKLLIPLIVQPMFTQQLGIFSAKIQDEKTLNQFYKTNPYPILTLQSNSAINHLNFYKKKENYILPLNKDYTIIKQSFNKNCKRNLKKAELESQNCHYTNDSQFFIDFVRRHNSYQLHEKHINILKRIIDLSLKKNCGFIIETKNISGETLACAFFLKKHGRITFLSGNSSERGFNLKSMFLIINTVIKDYANSENTLDFEGSSIKGVARFYKGFGAITEYYNYRQHPIIECVQKAKRIFIRK